MNQSRSWTSDLIIIIKYSKLTHGLINRQIGNNRSYKLFRYTSRAIWHLIPNEKEGWQSTRARRKFSWSRVGFVFKALTSKSTILERLKCGSNVVNKFSPLPLNLRYHLIPEVSAEVKLCNAFLTSRACGPPFTTIVDKYAPFQPSRDHG